MQQNERTVNRNERDTDPGADEGRGNDIVAKELHIEDVIAHRQEKALVRSGYRDLLIRILVLGLAVWLILTYGFLITQCSGQEMYPSIKDGDLCIIFRREAFRLMKQEYAAGDIVAYQAEGKRHFGRVVAIGGDTVQIDDTGSILVNGVTEGEDILYPTYVRGDDLVTLNIVQKNTLFVLGDYRTNTQDPRDFGPIPLDSVEGKVISILRRRGL